MALEAARHNLGDAATTTLSDGWAKVDDGDYFDWIVSNPPLHRGSVHDFTVCLELIDGATRHLTPGGSLWIVTQNHVPLGPLLQGGVGGNGAVEVRATDGAGAGVGWAQAVEVVSDGRFAVWRAVKAARNTVPAKDIKRKAASDVEVGPHSQKKAKREKADATGNEKSKVKIRKAMSASPPTTKCVESEKKKKRKKKKEEDLEGKEKRKEKRKPGGITELRGRAAELSTDDLIEELARRTGALGAYRT